jgi:hypothetical protein
MPYQKKTSTLFLSCFIAATLDICSAFLINYHTSPLIIFRFIASGVFGKAAFSGGNGMVWWGVLFHYTIAITFSAILFILYPRIKKIIRNPYLIALSYGILVWLLMNLAVLPLSQVPKFPFSAYGVSTGLLALIICIGLPVSLAADRYYRQSGA